MLQRALPGLGLTLAVLLAAFLALIGVPFLPMLLVVAALAGYHVIGLRNRVAVLPADQRRAFLRPHVRWLAIMAACGLGVGVLSLFLRAQLGFSALVALSLIGVGLLALAVRRAITDQP